MPESKPDEQQEQEIDPLALFPPQINKAVEGLAFLGQLTDECTFCGHSFGLRTLRPAHKFAIAQVLQPYRNTIAEPDIYQALYVATALTHVDHKRDFCEPIGPDLEGFVRGRLHYVANSETGWFPHTLTFLWNQYAILEMTAAKAVKELHFLSLRDQPKSSSPWLDSLVEPAPLTEETSSDSPPFTPFK
ncbi:MAG: hypothetical protein ABSA33_04155 [Candidatus Micrarchaeaceae archaeon]